MVSSPTVSIVIPVYNAELYLHQMIRSIQCQTLSDYELLFIDDGSTDKSLEICNRCAQEDARIRVFHQNNRGASAARNLGISESRGKYLIFFDADDEVEPEMLHAMVNAAQKNESELVVCGMYTDIVRNGQVVSSPKVSEPDCIITGNNCVRKYVIKMMKSSSIMYSPCNKLYVTSIVKNHSLEMREDIDIGEDLLFNLQYIRHIESLSMLSSGYYHYFQRDTENNLMSRFRENKADLMEIWVQEFTAFADEISDDPQMQDIVSWMKVRWFLSCFIEITASQKDHKEKRRYIKNVVQKEHLQKIRVPTLDLFQKIMVGVVSSGNTLLILFISKMIAFYKKEFKTRYYRTVTK